jgi:hypothetical protein
MEEARVVHGCLFFRWESSSSLNRQLTGASGAHCDERSTQVEARGW